MQNNAQPIPAPQDAIGWSPSRGWVFDNAEIAAVIRDTDDYVLRVTAADGMVHGVTATSTAPLAAVLRIDGDVADVVQRLADLGEHVAGIDTGETVDVNELRARVTALVRRVTRLEQA